LFVPVTSGPTIPAIDDELEVRSVFNLYTKRATTALTTIMTTPATIPPIAPDVNGEAGDGEVGDGEVNLAR